MFSKQCIKFSSTVLLLFTALVVGGCGTTTAYWATSENARDLSPAQARKLLLKTAQSVSGCGTPVTSGAVTHEKFQTSCEGPYRFAEYPALVAMVYIGDPVEGSAANKTCINVREVSVSRATGEGRWRREDCMVYRAGDYSAAARDFVRAWYVWAREGTTYYMAQEAAFERVAQEYLASASKPMLGEEARSFKVQAEDAVKNKRFEDAADLYAEALQVAPWWPEGYFNRALILGELKEFDTAVFEMKRYLRLAPDAADARAAQNKVYVWQAEVKRAEKH